MCLRRLRWSHDELRSDLEVPEQDSVGVEIKDLMMTSQVWWMIMLRK